jgi:hypothetical protein
MEAIQDFEDMLQFLNKHKVRYLIIGGLAFIYHAKPRYTKDMDLWIDPEPENVERANHALAEFGSPFLIDPKNIKEILQLGIAPDRIDFMLDVGGLKFNAAWEKRIEGGYGHVNANWIDIDNLICIKSTIDNPKHQEDARVLREVKKRHSRSGINKKKRKQDPS